MKIRNLLVVAATICCFGITNAQYANGQWAMGGDFSFVNNRNNFSRSSTAFSEDVSTGFGFSLLGGRFINSSLFMFGITDINYRSTNRNAVFDDFTNKQELRNRISTFGFSAGVGIRKYYAVNKRNIVGLFLQAQALGGATTYNETVYEKISDTVRRDFKNNSKTYLFNVQIKPGVYVNITPRWQLTFNMGNLYFTQTLVPKKYETVLGKGNSSFGLDINLFDFRIGALYVLPFNKKETPKAPLDAGAN